MRAVALGRAARVILLFLASAAITASAADGDDDGDGEDTAVEPIPDDAAVWRVLRHRWWRDLPQAPAGPMVQAAGPDSLSVTWTVPDSATDIDGYDVEYRADDTSEFTSWEHADSSTSTTIDGLASSTIHHVRVRAINDAGAGDWSPSGQGTTTNSVPRFVDGDTTTRSVPENTPGGRDVGTPVAASDAEGGSLQYSLGGEDADSFDLDTASGQIRTREGVVYDHETESEMAVTVSVDDGHGGTASIAVTVEVTNLYEPPDKPDPATVTASSSTSLAATWSEPNNTGTPIVDYDIRYRLAGTTIHYLDADQDGIFFAATITDLDPSTDYEVQVRAVNFEDIGNWSDPTSARTLANQPPVFSEGDNATREVAEDTSAHSDIGEPVAATDADGDALSYTLSGPDAEKFAVDADSGQISSAVAFDHETDASHEVTVEAADPHGGRASIAVTITVTDVAEPPGRVPRPTVTGVSGTVVRINWQRPANEGPPIHDYDVRYRVADSGDSFVRVSHDGASRAAFIRGLEPSTNYAVQVRARNPERAGSWSSSGTGATLDNGAPVFDEGAATTRNVRENSPGGRNVGAPVQATDPDDHALTYTLGGSDATAFTIASATGQLATRTGRNYDHEANRTYEVTVTADDGHGGRDDIDVTVRVTDVLEPPLAPDQPTVKAGDVDTLEVDWTAPANTGRPEVTGYNLQYRSTGNFTVLPDTFTTTHAEIENLDDDDYEVQVRAINDEGNGAWSPSGHATVAGNQSPVVDESLLTDVWVAVGGEDQPASVRAAFSDPDGDSLTLSAISRDVGIATATLSGNSVLVHAVSEGNVEVDVSAADPAGATASGSFKVSVAASPAAAPALGLNSTQDLLTVQFTVSLPPRATRAWSIRTRKKSSRTTVRTHCLALSSIADETLDLLVTARIAIGTFTEQDTTYIVDYRQTGTGCSGSPTSAWSAAAEFTPTEPTTTGNFDIELVFASPEPPEAVKSAFNAAVDLWEQAITNDLTDIDYAPDPTTNPCTEGEFDGVVDDLRVLVRTKTIDGEGGTLGTAGICETRSLSGLPIMSTISLDSADVERLGHGAARALAVHELAHALGFGILWDGLLVNPSLDGNEPIDPPPDTHFDGSNAIAAFDDAGGADYENKKVPVENERGGSGAQDGHWRKSVMGSELMTYTLGSGSEFSAISIQSMADMGYAVDDSVADDYTLPSTSGSTSLTARDEDGRLPLNCVVHPPAGIRIVPEPPIPLPPSALQLRIIDDSPGQKPAPR